VASEWTSSSSSSRPLRLSDQLLPAPSLGPATSESYHNLLRPLPHGAGLSSREATHVIQAERDNLELICEIIEKEKMDVDLWRGDLVEGEGVSCAGEELTEG
jgi:hypothetical protein